MRKLHIAIIIISVVLFSLIYFSVFGIQTVSTDKKTYSSGEEVKIHWSNINLEWCSCSNRGIAIFKQGATGWERIQYVIYSFGGGVCINGEIAGAVMPCDVIICSFPRINSESGDFSWHSKMYEMKGIVNSCLNPFSNEVINMTMTNYEMKNASSGKYKIMFGNAQEIIEIE
jgi:hypothetical protein